MDLLNRNDARDLLASHGLKVTGPRLAVLIMLSEAEQPLSHSELCEKMGSVDWDPATVYRNLVRMSEVGLARVVSRLDGVSRYAFQDSHQENVHAHPHFHCQRCGEIYCLSEEVTTRVHVKGPWALALKEAKVQFEGICPACLAD